MQFQLPEQLQLEVIKYDATRKKLANEQAKAERQARKKATFPRGNVAPLGLIPEEIVSLEEQAEAIKEINAASSENAYHLFSVIDPSDNEAKHTAIIYFTKQLWVSFWLPPAAEKDYWYGMSIAHRNTKTARKQMTNRYWPNKKVLGESMYDIEGLKSTKIGKTEWLHKTVFMTQDLINDGYTEEYWLDVTNNHQLYSYKGSTHNITLATKRVAQVLTSRVPTWSHDRGWRGGMWARTIPEYNTIGYCFRSMRWSMLTDEAMQSFNNSIDWWLPMFNSRAKSQALLSNNGVPTAQLKLTESPWFRKKLTAQIQLTQAAYDTEIANQTANRKEITRHMGEFYLFFEQVGDLCRLYPDANLDLLISRYDLLIETNMHFNHEKHVAHLWVADNLPITSYLNMLERFHAKIVEERSGHQIYSYDISDDSERVRYYYRDFDDCFDMLKQCLLYNNKMRDQPEFKPLKVTPKRWRLTEWHDQLMSETWKISNPNTSLPQKLFPEPIKWEQCDDGTDNRYSFFQPLDTHMLSSWGQAVRNCVGSHGYADRIKKYQRMIVLTMIDGKPRYTIELSVDNGVMHVNQIADVGNGRLSDMERDHVEDALRQAITIREQQLQTD